jgi:hypothetical protein
MYDAYRCCSLPKMRERVLFIGTQFSILYIEHKKHEYREEIYAELRGRSAIEDVRVVEML